MFKAIGKLKLNMKRIFRELKQALIDEGFLESDEEEEWYVEVCGHVHRGKKTTKRVSIM